jgi:hypothetical protein
MSIRAKRKREMETGFERKRRLRRLTVNDPELDDIWLLIAKGTSSTGAACLVERYPDAVLPEELNRAVEMEIRYHRPWSCLRCGERIEPQRVVLPDRFFLQIMEEERLLIEEWAYKGNFRQEFPVCPKCGLKQPPVEEKFSIFGRASEVIEWLQRGLNFVKEPPEPIFFRIINIKCPNLLRIFVGLVAIAGAFLIIWMYIWAIGFLVVYFRMVLASFT